MRKCPKCKTDMILIQDDHEFPYNWGGYRLYGCRKCGKVLFEHTEEEHPKQPRPKPIYDPGRHHDSHLIN